MTADGVEFPYRTAAAFRTALRDKLSTLARSGGHGLDDLQRQFAYDRVLARTFSAPDADRWVLKGAGALLARLPEARHSRDIDLAFTAGQGQDPSGTYDSDPSPVDQAVASLTTAMAMDLGDFFRFEITRTSPLQEMAKGRRLHVVAYLGARYASFHVDVVVGTVMTGIPQSGSPLTAVAVTGLTRPDYRLFPLEDHVADKVCAITEGHEGPAGPQSSTRVKDLVDLALIAMTQELDAPRLRRAVTAGVLHRGLALERRFSVPDTELWQQGYAARAREAATAVPGRDDAVQLVRALLDPILEGTATGTWDPRSRRWRDDRVSHRPQ